MTLLFIATGLASFAGIAARFTVRALRKTDHPYPVR